MDRPELIKLIQKQGPGVTRLNLAGLEITELPPELFNLGSLMMLDLSSNKLSTIPAEIGMLTKLRWLSFSGNQLKTIPRTIGNLVELTVLDLNNNGLKNIPDELDNLGKLGWLNLNGNQLPVPPEILALTDKPSEIMNYYRQHLTAQKRNLNEAKMLIVGQGGVGKTSLVNRLVEDVYDPHERKTEGIKIDKWQLSAGGEQIKINIWDFGGQEIMHATHQFFLTKRSLYVLVLDARQGEQESKVEYWLKLIQSFGGDSPIIVVINKIDEQRLDIDRRGLTLKYQTIKAFIETSCEKNLGVDGLKKVIGEQVVKIEHIHDQLLISWFAVKTKLEKMHQDFISYEDYKKLCEEEDIGDDLSQKTLIRFLHDLGIVLNFQDDARLSDTNILNPQWVTAAVYKILNSFELFQSKGVLSLKELARILSVETYPQSKHLFIVEMMEKFELCFGFEGADTYLIPELLSKEEPDINWDHEDSLSFQYHYNFFPLSVISRFIVRMNSYISKNTYWRTGVVLSSKGNKALVKADVEDKKIFVYVSGKQQTRRTFLAIIRSHFDHIHNPIPKIEAKEMVPLPDNQDVVVEYNHLLVLEEKGHKAFVPVGLESEVEVELLLNGIDTERRRKKQEEKKEDRIHSALDVVPAPVHRNNPWIAGSFYLIVFVVVVTALVVVSKYAAWQILPIVLIAALLAIPIIGALQLKNDERFTDESFLTLIRESFKRLPLLKGGSASERSKDD